MPLPRTTTSLDNIPEAKRGAYDEQSDGTFLLDVDLTGYESAEDVRGLKTALEKEREEARTGRLDATDLRKRLDGFGDLTATELERLRKADRDTRTRDAGGDPDNVEKLLDERTEELRNRHVADLKKRDEQVADLTGKLESTQTRLETTVINNDLRAAINDVKEFRPEAVDDLLLLSKGIWRLNEGGKPAAYEQVDGRESLIEDEGGNAVTIKAWILSLKERKPHWFATVEGSGTGHDGGGTGEGTGGGRWKGKSRKDMSPSDKVQAVKDLGSSEEYMRVTVR